MKNLYSSFFACVCFIATAAMAQTDSAAAKPPAAAPAQSVVETTTTNGVVKVIIDVNKQKEDSLDSYFEIELSNNESSGNFNSLFARRKGNAKKPLSGMLNLAGTTDNSTKFVFSSSFQSVGEAKGFGIEIGGRAGKHQILATFGCDFDWLIGGGIEYQNYRLSLNNIINLAWGVTGGYWYYEKEVSSYSDSSSHSEEYFFVGPVIKFEVGSEKFHLFYKVTVLIGSVTAGRMDYGLTMSL